MPHDALTPTTAFKTDAEILAGVAGVYAQLRTAEGDRTTSTLEELTTDKLGRPDARQRLVRQRTVAGDPQADLDAEQRRRARRS